MLGIYMLALCFQHPVQGLAHLTSTLGKAKYISEQTLFQYAKHVTVLFHPPELYF